MTAADLSTDNRAPRVSVLMTTYNGERFIAESIDSVLGQSFDDFELIVVDDNSTDNTRAILARYDDPRMRILHNATNLGVVGARNRGFAALRGAYVATLDHDDLWRPTRLRAGVDCLDGNPETVLVATRTKVLVDGLLGPPATTFSGISPLLFHWILLMTCPVVYSSLLFRRDAARRDDGTFLRPDLRYADDHQLMLRLAFAGRVEVLDEDLTIYRVHGTNTTRRVYDEMHLKAVAMLTESYARFLDDDAADAARLVALHVTRGYPVPDRRTSRRLGGLLARLAGAFIKTYHPDTRDRARIERHAGEMYWRVLRASIRSGRIWCIGDYWQPPGSVVQPKVGLGDMAGSVAAGLLRLPRYVLGYSDGGPHNEGG
jgi:glycosyltransferase involved in cell wall biosynthesis